MPAIALRDHLQLGACRAYFLYLLTRLRGACGRISEETMQRYDTGGGGPAVKRRQQIPQSIRGPSAPATAVQRETRAPVVAPTVTCNACRDARSVRLYMSLLALLLDIHPSQ